MTLSACGNARSRLDPGQRASRAAEVSSLKVWQVEVSSPQGVGIVLYGSLFLNMYAILADVQRFSPPGS